MNKFQVAIVGINSLFGGTSALLLKQSPFIKCLKLYDQNNVDAAFDLSAINTQCKVKMFLGNEQLMNAFEGADVIVISDEANEAVMSSDSHLMTTASTFRSYAKAIAQAAPHAIIVVASTPINCLLPIMSQLLVKEGCYNHNKVVGSTLVDTIRASSILASHLNLDPKEVVLPVIGGSSERTRVPVFSQSKPYFSLRKDEKTNIIMNIRRGDAQVLANKGSPEILNRAYSTVRFLNSIMAGLRGDSNVTDITMCRTDLVPGVEYFSLPVIFGKDGVVKRYGVPKTTEIEDEMVEEAVKHVRKDADKAAFIVRGAIDLPQQKYLSANERASSQKEIFDLYVKCLPKPDNKRDPVADKIVETPTNYSFKNLINGGSSINHTDLAGDKSFRRLSADKLKNVASNDSFLKSTGFFTSPLQRPIFILEPMGCPSAPQNFYDNDELAHVEDQESGFVLHEENLSKTCCGGFNSTEPGRVKATVCTRQSPLSTYELAQPKTIDPIKNLKEKSIEEDGSYHHHRAAPKSSKYSAQNTNICGSKIDIDEELEDIHKLGDENLQSGFQCREDEEEIDESPSAEVELCESEEEINSEESNGMKEYSTFLYNTRSDRPLPVKHRDFQLSSPEQDRFQDIVVNDAKYHKMDKDEKYRKLVSRLFRKLDGLNQGMFSPLKSSDSEKIGKQSFAEAAIRSKTHWSSAGKMFMKNSALKRGFSESCLGADDCKYPQNNLGFKKDRKAAPTIESFVNKSTENCCSTMKKRDENRDGGSKLGTLQVVCPNCQNKITYSPSEGNKDITMDKTNTKKVDEAPKENIAADKKEVEIKRINVAHYGPRPDYFRTSCYSDERGNVAATASQPALHSTPGEKGLQEDRLRKLKEKINEKLIPLLNGTPAFPVECTVSQPEAKTVLKSRDENPPQLNDDKSASGTPFCVEKQEFSIEKDNYSGSKADIQATGKKWQGVPFVVKLDKEKPERRREEELRECDQICRKPQEGTGNTPTIHKRSSKTTNKLQMLGTSSELSKSVQDDNKAGVVESGKSLTDAAVKFSKKETTNLNSEDVQNYMQSRLKVVFTRKQKNSDSVSQGRKDCDDKLEKPEELNESKSQSQKIAKSQPGDLNEAKSQSQTIAKSQPGDLNKAKSQSGDSNKAKSQSGDSNKAKSQSQAITKSQSGDSNKAKSQSQIIAKSQSGDSNKAKSQSGDSNKAKSQSGDSNKAKSQSQAIAKSQSGDSNKAKSQSQTIAKSQPGDSNKAKSQSGDSNKAKSQSGDSNKAKSQSQAIAKSQPQHNQTQNEANLKTESAFQKTNNDASDSKSTAILAHDASNPKPAEESKSNTAVAVNEVSDKPKEEKLDVYTKESEASRSVLNAENSKQAQQKLGKIADVSHFDNKRSAPVIKGDDRSQPLIELIIGPNKSTNKLKLLAKAREMKISSGKSLDGKLKNVWEQTLSGEIGLNREARQRFACRKKNTDLAGLLGKTSAAVKIASSSSSSKKLTSFKVKLKAPSKSSNILEGLKFPSGKPKIKPTHNLLKCLASLSTEKGPRRFADINKRSVRRSLDVTNRARSNKDVVKDVNLSPNRICQKNEYARDEEKLAAAAFEVIQNRKLTRPQTEEKVFNSFESKFDAQKRKRCSSSARNLRHQWTDYSISDPSEREFRMRKSADEVLSKVTKMPQIRHQMENLETPLGPMEVQPGLAPLSFAVTRFPTAENSWESVLFSEYVRSNLLPSLKDTRETFHFEERPS